MGQGGHHAACSITLTPTSGHRIVGGLNSLYAVSGTVTGGFSAPVFLASGAGSNKYNPIGTSQVALNNAGQASVAWSVLSGHTGVLTRSASGAWSTETVLNTRTVPAITVSTAIDGAGNAFIFAAGATSFGTGSGSHTSLGDLKIVPGQAVLLAADALSTETVN